MRKMRCFLVLLCTVMLFLPAQAERVNIEKAEKVARSYARVTPRLSARHDFRHSRTVSKRVNRNLPGLRSAQQQDEPMYHVFTMNGNGGFIVIAGDDVAKPVLGYADEGTFDETNPNLTYWLESLAQEIAGAIENDLPQDDETKAAWEAFESENNLSLRASGDYVDPLLKTKWNQGAPYNKQCVSGSGLSNSVTGCVATAMVQIMKHHNYPDSRSEGIPGYKTRTQNITVNAIPGTRTYEWGSMTNTYVSTATGAAADAVAKLMYHCGVSVEMDYKAGESGAYSEDVSGALKTYFGYDAGATYLRRNYYSYTEWVNLLKTELKANRPVYYSGRGSGGHAFVCDGYDTGDLFHFNWGWGGMSDGYFEISALNPHALGIGGGSGGYNSDQGMVTGIRPAPSGSGQPAINLRLHSISTDPASLPALGGTFTVKGTDLANLGSATVNTVYLGVILCHLDDTPIEYKTASCNLGLNAGFYRSIYTIYTNYTLPSNLQLGKNYKLYPAFSASGSEMPTKMSGLDGTPCIIVSVASDGKVTLSNTIQPVLALNSITSVGNVYQNKTGSFKAQITNSGTADYKSNLRLMLGSTAVATEPVVIPAGATKDVGFTGTVTVSPDSYTPSVWYDATNTTGGSPGTQLGISSNITVAASPGNFSLSPTISFASVNNVPQNAPNLTVTVKNTGGLFTGQIEVLIFPAPGAGNTNIASFGSKSVVIENNGTATIGFNDPIDFLTPGTSYRAIVYYNAGGGLTSIGNAVVFTVGAPSSASQSSDASLTSLTVKNVLTQQAIALNETFAPGTLTYTAAVSDEVTQISVTGEATHPRAKFTNLENVTLTNGTNTVSIPVTAENGTTTQTYQITITKGTPVVTYGISIGTLSNGRVTPNKTQYTAGETVTLTIEPDAGYELDNLAVTQNSDNSSVTLSGTGNTRTFTMPASAVTVTASFKKTVATLLAEAKALVESADIAANYTVTQTQANTSTDVTTWLAAQLNALLSGKGIETVTTSDITLAGFTAAYLGTNGSFNFTVTLKIGGNSQQATKTGCVITATPVYNVTVTTPTNGSVTVDKSKAAANETVTLTLTPAAGYELKSLTVIQTGGSGSTSFTPVLAAADGTYTFAMPAYDVTVTAAFDKTADQQAVENLKTQIENATYTVAQAQANDESNVTAWLVNTINTPITSTGITIAANIQNVTPATEGNSTNLSGTDGSFTFQITLTKGSSALTTASKTGVITATPAYTVNTSGTTNGSITASPTVAKAGETVTLVITPATGYELTPNSVYLYREGETAGGVPVSGNTFTMPDYNVTVTASFRETADQLAVKAAKAAIETATYTIAQASATDASAITSWLTGVINGLSGVSGTGVTVSDYQVTVTKTATAGTNTDLDGENGAFTFTVKLKQGSIETVTQSVSGTIQATLYVIYARAIHIQGTTNGTISSSPSGSANENAPVTLTVSPDAGYELNGSISVTGNSTSTSITVTGSANPYTFTMPNEAVTVAATFKKNADQTATEAAVTTVQGYTYNVMQHTANTPEQVKTWLNGEITTLLGSGITITDITVITPFTPATVGTAGTLSGTPGNFTFTVSLKKGGSATVTTGALSGTIVATPAYAVATGTCLNGTVTADKAAALPGETVTLTATPVNATYELNHIKVYQTGAPAGAGLLLTVSGSLYTFVMPAWGVTVEASFGKTADQQDVETAQSLIEAAVSYTIAQSTANTNTTVKAPLAAQINALPGMIETGITVKASDITVSGFTAATAGASGALAGTNGAFTFTVHLTKGAGTITTASKTGTITATPAYQVSIGTYSNGSVSTDKAAALQGETVTLTATPAGTGYEVESVSVVRAGGTETITPVSGAANSYTFVMPAYHVTVTATFRKTADRTALEKAQAAIEGATYTVAQATANTEAQVKTWLVQQINALSDMSGTGITIAAAHIATSGFTPAVAGDAVVTIGSNGDFSFTVTLTKGAGTITTASKTGTITATPYTAPETFAISMLGATNGTVAASPSASIEPATLVTLTISPATGYELNAISAYKTGEPATTVTLNGSDNSRTFPMPAYHVTVSASFKKTGDLTAVENAKAILESETFGVAQATANTQAEIENWLLTEINSRIASTGVAVQATDITVSAVTLATAGAAGSPSGTNGSFTFTVTLTKGSFTLSASTLSGTITATGWALPAGTVTVSASVNGTVTAAPSNPVSQNATVTLTLSPAAGYMPDAVTVCQTGNTSVTVPVHVADANTRTFTMPGHDVTVTATFKVIPDQLAVESAESLILAGAYSLTQSEASSLADVQTRLVAQINALIASTGVTVTASNITVTGFTAATAGTASSPSGANGSFTFTVTLTKGLSTLTTPARSGVITATAFGATPYTVAVASTTNGSVTASPSGPVYAGTAVTLTLAPSTGYGVGTVRVYRTGTPSATVTLSGSGYTRTFTMPAGNVTVEVTFLPVVQLSAQQDVNNARLRIENATFNVSQATANTTSALRTWLVGQINSLIALTGVTVSASDITISGFTAATGGTAALPSGADGGYTFTVSLEKGGALAVTSAKAGRIIAIAYTPVQYAITLGTSINGRVTANAASAPAGATVTLTITPNTGYELDSIRAYHAGGASVPVTLSGSGSTRTFVMPASGVTVTIRFKKTPHQINIETVETAKISIEGGTYHIAQATGNTEASVESWLSGVLNLLLSGRNAVITFRSGEADVLAADAKLYSFTPAVVGTATHPAGTDGSFRFTVLLTKGDIHVETLEVNGVIVATPHAADPVKRIELLSLGETRVRIINTGNSETGNLTVGISGAHVDVFTLPSATSGSLSVGGEADLALVPRQDLAPGAYTVTVTVGGEGVTPVSLEIVYHVWSTGSEAVSGRQVWTAGSTLYIAAATAGEARVFGTAGQFVKAIPHAAGETVETVLPQGFYLVVAEGKTYKVLIR